MKIYIFLLINKIVAMNDGIKTKINEIKNYILGKIKLGDNNIPLQNIEIIEFNDTYVIVKSTKLLGIKHCFFKAIEFFNSKYEKFFLKIDYIEENEDFIKIKFIAYDIKK